jgi:hypothetical protein
MLNKMSSRSRKKLAQKQKSLSRYKENCNYIWNVPDEPEPEDQKFDDIESLLTYKELLHQQLEKAKLCHLQRIQFRDNFIPEEHQDENHEYAIEYTENIIKILVRRIQVVDLMITEYTGTTGYTELEYEMGEKDEMDEYNEPPKSQSTKKSSGKKKKSKSRSVKNKNSSKNETDDDIFEKMEMDIIRNKMNRLDSIAANEDILYELHDSLTELESTGKSWKDIYDIIIPMIDKALYTYEYKIARDKMEKAVNVATESEKMLILQNKFESNDVFIQILDKIIKNHEQHEYINLEIHILETVYEMDFRTIAYQNVRDFKHVVSNHVIDIYEDQHLKSTKFPTFTAGKQIYKKNQLKHCVDIELLYSINGIWIPANDNEQVIDIDRIKDGYTNLRLVITMNEEKTFKFLMRSRFS